MAADKKKIRNNALFNYFQASFEELRKVSWPTRNQAIKLTFLVLGFCLAIAVLLGVLDFVFGMSYRALLDLGPERTIPTVAEQTTSGGETAPLELGDVSVDADGAVTIDIGGEESVVIDEGTLEGETVTVDAGAVTESVPTDDAAPTEETPTEDIPTI